MVEKRSNESNNEALEPEETEEVSDKKSTKNLMLIVIIIIGLLVLFFSIKYLYHPETNEESYMYNQFKFTRMSGLWFTEIQAADKVFRIPTRYSPRELEQISIEPNVYGKVIGSREIYLTVSNNLSSVAVLAAIEVGRIIGTRYGVLNIPSTGALTEWANDETPVKTCKDAVNGTGIIWFKIGNKTAVYSDKNCVIVQGKDEWDIVKAADRLAFGLLGIMP